MESKFCKRCSQEKPLSAFYKNNRTKDGLAYYCGECSKAMIYASPNYRENIRKNLLQNLYGIKQDDYLKLAEKQEHKCAICSKTSDSVESRKKYLSVDHDHDTGKIRGLLCQNCNMGLGKFQDDPALLNKAVMYLLSHSEQGE